MSALTFTLSTDWEAANRYTAAIDTYVLLSNAGEPSVAWTMTDSDLIPAITPRQANVLVRDSAFQLMVPAGQRLWLSKRGVDTQLESVATIERGVPGPIPPVLLTDNLGPSQRLRVDVAQTGFFAGREFRTFREFTGAATGQLVIKAVVPIDIVLFELGMTVESGSFRMATVAAGTPGGTFAETLPVFSTNNMLEKPQPPYVAQTVLTAGGTITGGIVLDVLRGKTADNSNFAASVGFGQGAERGILPGTYHFLIDFVTFTGVLKARWEERL